MKRLAKKTAELLLPSVYVALVNRQISSEKARDPREPPEALVEVVEGDGDLQNEARDLYVEESQRLVGMEVKARALTTYISIAIPFVTAALGTGLMVDDLPATFLAGLSAMHLVLALALSIRGVTTTAVHVLRRSDLLGAANAESETGGWLAARRLQIAELNEPIGWQRQNAVWAGQASLIWAIVLLSASGFQLLLVS